MSSRWWPSSKGSDRCSVGGLCFIFRPASFIESSSSAVVVVVGRWLGKVTLRYLTTLRAKECTCIYYTRTAER